MEPRDSISTIELRYGIRLPGHYVRWVEAGYTDRASSSYLWVWEAEWIPPADIASYAFNSEPRLRQLVPFAANGAGDTWCWHCERSTDRHEYVILLCEHDSDLAWVYAPSFAAWFYRQCIAYATSVGRDSESVAAAIGNLTLWARRLAELGKPEWAQNLRRLAAAGPRDYTWGPRQLLEHGFLTLSEEESLTRDVFGAGYVDERIAWR